METKKPKDQQELVKVQNGGVKKDVLGLTADFGIVYTKVQEGQIMAPIRADMTLYEKLGHIYKQKDKYPITGPGYRYLNKVASISLVTPQSVIVDGRPVPNPHIERNPKTKSVESVNIRKMGIGYSPAGNIVVIDKTLFYNVYTYFIQSIQAKMKRVVWASGKPTDAKEFPDCAVYGTADERPTKPGKWAFYLTEDPIGIWINYESPAIIDCLEEHTQRQRFGDRIAATIVERNILKDHPAIAVSQVFYRETTLGVQATVTVHGWRNDNTPRNLAAIMRQAESGKESGDFHDAIEVKAETIVDLEAEEEIEARKEASEIEMDTLQPEDMGDPAKDKEPPAAFFEKQAKEKAKK